MTPANAAAALRQARVDAGLSQAALARRAGVDQPMVSAYEHGRRAPSWTTFERLVGGAGAVAELRVEPLPDNAFTVADLGVHVAAGTDDPRRRRLVLEFLARYAATPSHQRRALLVGRPDPTGERTWDALLGATAEHLAFHDAVDPPEWCVEAGRFLDRPWYWVDLPSVRRRALAGAPTAFRRRNVWVDRIDLERR
jgi:transcriptional regulator with XRE-family HTH domain